MAVVTWRALHTVLALAVALLPAWLLAGCGSPTFGLVNTGAAAPAGDDETPARPRPFTMRFMVDGVERTALIYPGAVAPGTPSPLLFAFHGFGGSAAGMAALAKFYREWPAATVVYPQGLPVLKPSTGVWRPGWPDEPGKYGDRDVRFVEVMLRELRRAYTIDEQRIYAAGMSNGATFTYLLYVQRPQAFTAFAGVAGPAIFLDQARVPRPLMSVNGAQDPFVYPALAELMLEQFRIANQFEAAPEPWRFDSYYTYYPPKREGAPLVWRRHDGGHTWPNDATTRITWFFQDTVSPVPLAP